MAKQKKNQHVEEELIAIEKLDMENVYNSSFKEVIQEHKDMFVEDTLLHFYITGNSVIDNLLSNGGGLPLARTVMFSGNKNVGKSTLALNIASTAIHINKLLKENKIPEDIKHMFSYTDVHYIDTEQALSKQRMNMLNIEDSGMHNFAVWNISLIPDFYDFLLNLVKTKEKYLEKNQNQAGLKREAEALLKKANIAVTSKTLKAMMDKLKKYNEDEYNKHVIVILDSVAELGVSQEAMDRNVTSTVIAERAREWSSITSSGIFNRLSRANVSIIFINQLRNVINTRSTFGGPQQTTVGGVSLGYKVFMDIRLSSRGSFLDKLVDTIVFIKNEKNKAGGINGVAIFNYKYGFTETWSVYYTLKEVFKVIDRNKIRYGELEDKWGTVRKDKFYELFNNNLEFRNDIYDILEDKAGILAEKFGIEEFTPFIINPIYRTLLLADHFDDDTLSQSVESEIDELIEAEIKAHKVEEAEKQKKMLDKIKKKAEKIDDINN